MSSKVLSDFDQWKELNAKLENRFALMEQITNLANITGTQMLTAEEQQLKKDTPSLKKRLRQEIPSLQEEIKNVENKIKGKKGNEKEKKKLKEEIKNKYPAKKKAPEKKKETYMINLPKEGDKTPPLEILPPLSGLGLTTTRALKRHLARQAQVRKETKNKKALEESYPYLGQEKLHDYGSPPLPFDKRNMPPMEKYGYPSGDDQTSGDFGDNTKSTHTLGGKRRKKKSRRRRRTKKKKRRRKKKTRKKRKKRKRRRRTKKN